MDVISGSARQQNAVEDEFDNFERYADGTVVRHDE